jgi:magnesium transporter
MIGALLQADLEEIIRNKNWDELREALSELDPADIAEVLVELPPEDQGIIFRILPRQRAADVFEHLPLEKQRELVQSLSSAQMKSILDEMSPDDRTRLFEELPAEVTRRLLETLSPDELKSARELLGYPEDTAGRYMTPEYVALPPDITAAEALERIRAAPRDFDVISVLYIVNEKGRLLEDLPLGALVMARPDTMIGDIEVRTLVFLRATDDLQTVLSTFEHYDRAALPVVDDQMHLLGVITADDALDVAEQEATEDIQKLGGMEALEEPYVSVSVWTMFRKRGVWLTLLFVGQMLTATVMERFEGAIAQALVLAIFIPLIISSGGNSGSQATSLIIRALALGEVKLRDWARVLRREFACALMLGLWLGLIGLLRVQLWHQLGWQDYTGHAALVALVVALALVGVVLWGSLVGSMLPFALQRVGLDPATSSAPFVATLVDVTGLIIYFSVALIVLHGTLL